jgi:putative heme transporter
VRGALQLVVGLVLAAVALWVVAGKRGELEGAFSYLDHLHWTWLVATVLAEFGAIVAFAAMERRLLAEGGADMSLGLLTGITLAGNAIQNSLPGGPVWANLFAYRQFRRRGADFTLSAWTLVAMSILSAVSLAAIAAVGVAIARNEGVFLDAVVLIAVIAGLVLAVRFLLARHAVTLRMATAVVRLAQRVVRRPPGDARQVVESGWQRLTAVKPSSASWTVAFLMAAANWLWDCCALAMAFLAVGSGVPWRGLLLAYGAAQLATNIPITPGGLGVVEGSLTIALVAYGGGTESTVAAVVLYRLISFWGLLAVGWLAWAAFAYEGRRRRAQSAEPVVAAEVQAP